MPVNNFAQTILEAQRMAIAHSGDRTAYVGFVYDSWLYTIESYTGRHGRIDENNLSILLEHHVHDR